MQTAAPQYVTRVDSEQLIAALERLPGSDNEGFFGPSSITWRVNRESAVFLGAGRAALLQLAHPWVAASLVHHSNLLNDAIGRFHSTFRVIYTMLFGTRAQAVASARQLYRRHTGIRGSTPQGEHYEANEIAALRWVYATLVESALLAYETVLPPLEPAEREQYYAESKRMGALFGIPSEALPADWQSFTDYTAEVFASSLLEVGPDALALGRSVMSGAGTRLHVPHWYQALTSAWLPVRLRLAFELPDAALAPRWLAPVYRLLPASLRWVGPWHEATARLSHRPPSSFTRQSNQFWMGQPLLLYPQAAPNVDDASASKGR